MSQANHLPGFDFSTMVGLLLERAMPNLSRRELEWLQGGAGDLAITLASQWRAMAVEVGCLVAEDATSATRAGSLQSGESVARLLFLMSSQFDLLAGLSSVQYGAEVWQSVKQYDREREAVA